LRYLNASKSVKTVYGVKFNPGDSHDVPGYINVPGFIRVADLPKEPPKAVKTVNELPKQPAKTTSAGAAKAESKPEAPKVATTEPEQVDDSVKAVESENSTTQ